MLNLVYFYKTKLDGGVGLSLWSCPFLFLMATAASQQVVFRVIVMMQLKESL